MKVIFLDFDGVLNKHHATSERWRGFIGIDRRIIPILNRLLEATGAKVVVSSSWRYDMDWRDALIEAGANLDPFIGVTIMNKGMTSRGTEIKHWLGNQSVMSNFVVEKYAILDDNSDMLEEQMLNFFQTQFNVGLTEEIADKIIEHFKVGGDV